MKGSPYKNFIVEVYEVDEHGDQVGKATAYQMTASNDQTVEVPAGKRARIKDPIDPDTKRVTDEWSIAK